MMLGLMHQSYALPERQALQLLLVNIVHQYKTRLASRSTYYIHPVKTNYGKFNIRFAAVKVWNDLDENIKYLPLKMFKNEVKLNILQKYCQH